MRHRIVIIIKICRNGRFNPMKHLTKSHILEAFVLGVGLIGWYLQLWLHGTGFDAAGLLKTGHPAVALLWILCAAALAGVMLYIRPVTGPMPYKKLFPKSRFSFVCSLIGAVGILITDISEIIAKQDTITFLSGVIGILAAFCLVIAGLLRMLRMRPRYWLHGIVTVYLMIHLISQYRTWNSEPQLLLYCFQLLASVSLMFSAYYRTLLDTGKSCRRVYLFFTCSAILFCCLSLNGETPLFYLSLGILMAGSLCSMAPGKDMPSMVLPKNVQLCIRSLEDAGYSAYVVGGCVRDTLLGLTPADYDLCTNATPEQIAGVFSRYSLVRNGEKHGTIGVVMGHQVYEITTFRSESTYSDNRHPDAVEYVATVTEDLSRRDFTINAIAYAPGEGYIDPFGGYQDLNRKILRTVGEPEQRFREDALRILRGVRFATRFRLEIEENTKGAMLSLSALMDNLARERVMSELSKLLLQVKAQDILDYGAIFTQIIPELAPCVGFEQHNIHHTHDVFTHTAYTVEKVMPQLSLKLAALLHDIGKPATFTLDEQGQGHFFEHTKVSAQMAEDILLRLRVSNQLREQVVFLVAHHMTPMVPDKKLLRRRISQYGEDMTYQLLQLQKADMESTGVVSTHNLEEVELLLAEIMQEDACLTVKDLAVNGNDLLELGFAAGPQIGACMAFLLELVQDELIENTREDLLPAAQSFLSENQEDAE